MTELQEKAMRMALERLESHEYWMDEDAIQALRQALAQPKQKPAAWGFQNTAITGINRWMYLRETIPEDDQYRGVLWTPLYTAPPKREWVGLTDEDKQEACGHMEKVKGGFWEFANYLDAKLKEKNT